MSITDAASPMRMQNKKKYQYSERLARPEKVTNLLKQVEIASWNPRAGAPTYSPFMSTPFASLAAVCIEDTVVAVTGLRGGIGGGALIPREVWK
jgi:hypothetical protein